VGGNTRERSQAPQFCFPVFPDHENGTTEEKARYWDNNSSLSAFQHQRRSHEFDLGGYKLHDIEFVLVKETKQPHKKNLR